MLLFRKAGSHRRSHKLQRGFFARITNKVPQTPKPKP
jgi:hypothetical protein